MKPIVLALALVLPIAVVVSVGASALLFGVRRAQPREPIAAPAIVATPAAPAPSAEELRTLRGNYDMLSNRVAELENEIGRLREEASRTPVASASSLESTGELLAASSIGLTEPQRAAVLQVLSDERDRQERERAEERAQRELAEIQRRAERVAKELSMSASDQTTLVAFYTEASKRRDEMFAPMREGNFDRESARASFEELRDWSTKELTRLYGAPLAEQILALERDRRGWGGFDGGRGDRDRGGRDSDNGGGGF